jgi:uncharacterized membrane protein
VAAFSDGVIAILTMIMVLEHEAIQTGHRHGGGHSWTLRARLLS